MIQAFGAFLKCFFSPDVCSRQLFQLSMYGHDEFHACSYQISRRFSFFSFSMVTIDVFSFVCMHVHVIIQMKIKYFHI